MKTFLKIILATSVLVAFSGAQADTVDVNSCTADASTAAGTDAKNADAWVAGTYTETGSDLTVNGNDCWETNANQAISDSAGFSKEMTK